MTTSETTPSGLEAVGPLSWGSHFCHFYEDTDDLIQVLVPFYKAGLDQGERALWVVHKDMAEEDARSALRAAVPDLDAREAGGQIAIVGHERWYRAGGEFDAEPVLRGWIEGERNALASGFAGLRASGDTLWLGRNEWPRFTDYERRVTEEFRGRRLIALCSYCMSACGASEVLDVVGNHDFAVTRRQGRWEVVESASVAAAKAELAALNGALEERVAERTAALSRAMAEREVLFREVHHRVRNNLQVMCSMLNLKGRQSGDGAVRDAFREMAARIQAMGLVHSALYDRSGDCVSVEMGTYLATLAGSLLEAFHAEARVELRMAADGSALPLAQATTVGLVASELVMNALKHAFAQREGVLDFDYRRDGSDAVMTVVDDGPGFAAQPKTGRRLSGLALVDGFARQLGGTLQVSADAGVRATLRFPI